MPTIIQCYPPLTELYPEVPNHKFRI